MNTYTFIYNIHIIYVYIIYIYIYIYYLHIRHLTHQNPGSFAQATARGCWWSSRSGA